MRKRPKIPVWLLANPTLASGHSHALLLAAHPSTQNWSIVLEGGPGNLCLPLTTANTTLHQLAAQCVCCIGQLTLRVTLARIIRLEKPQRLILELCHTEHLEKVAALLSSSGFGDTLQLEPTPEHP